jgi:hypothetical protein
MWTPRTQEEQDKWLARTHAQARSFAILIGVSVFVGVTLAMSFGISLVPGGLMFMGFSPRPLGFTGAIVIGAFIGLGVGRDVRRSELKKNLSLTVCPRCGKMGQLNDGEKCRCGSSFVKTSKVRWVDDAIDETARQNDETSASNPAQQ